MRLVKTVHYCSRTSDTHTQRGVDNNPTGGFFSFHTLVSVNLRSQVDMHRLNVGVVLEGVLSKLATDCRSEVIRNQIRRRAPGEGTVRTPALLETTKRDVDVQRVGTVDPDRSSVQFVASLQGLIDVFGEDGSGKAVQGVIRLADNIFRVLKLDDSTNRAKDLLLDDLHIRSGFRENRGLNGSDVRISSDVTRDAKGWTYFDEVTLASKTFTTDVDFGTVLLARLDVRHDTLARLRTIIFVVEKGGGRTYIKSDFRDLWSLINALGKGVADLDRLDLLSELCKERVVDSGLDEDTSASAATLAVVPTRRRPD